MCSALSIVQGPSRSVLAMSAFMPGLGQFMQRRWLAGFFYCGAFVACCVYTSVCVQDITATAFEIVASIRNSTNYTPDISLTGMVVSCISGVVVYIMNMIDIFWAYRKASKEWSAWKLGRMHCE